MDTTSLVAWKSLLAMTPPDRSLALMQCLTPELQSLLERTSAGTLDPKLIETTSQELMRIHPSWMAPYLRTLPENDIKLFLAALDEFHIESLKQMLLLSNTLPFPSPLGKHFLQKKLLQELTPPDLLSSSLLPQDSLNELLTLSTEELYQLIHLLSMHDLSIEIRQIIQTSKLQEIYKVLSKSQMNFLKTLLHKKEPVAFKKMGLANWDGNAETLKNLLLQRGINRIAKSLYGKDKNLLWYMAHRLDMKQGQLLMKLCAPLDHPHAINFLVNHVLELIHTLKPHNPR